MEGESWRRRWRGREERSASGLQEEAEEKKDDRKGELSEQ
jgi:hypothetical protein